MKTSSVVTGVWEMYWLLPHVPAIMHNCVSSTSPEANPQASMSNMPPATGVPGASPVPAAAASVRVGVGLPNRRAKRPRKWPMSSVTSPGRCRSGGSSRGKTLSR